MQNDGGWMTTKKRGRDDEQIANDREAAKANRKTKKGAQTKRTAAPAARRKMDKKMAATRRGKMDSLAGNNDDYDDDSFVVGDDESEGEWDDGSSEEEDALLEEFPEEEDESNDSEASETFFPSYAKRTSKPPPSMQKLKKKRTMKAKNVAEIDLCSSEEESPVSKPKHKAKKNKVVAKRQTSSLSELLMSSEAESPLPTPYKSSAKEKASGSTAAHTKLQVHRPIKQSSDDREIAVMDLEDTPVVAATAIRKKPIQKKRRQILDSDDDDDDNDRKYISAKLPVSTGDYCSDEDEAFAMVYMLEQSRKDAQKVSTADNSLPGETSPQPPEVLELEDSSDDEDGDEQDGYVDETAREASSILDTANELSAQVLKTMSGWSKGATNGMIVDGALALYSMGSGENTETDHTWISEEKMREILPDVKLADYQIIGVNWLALLHGMKCEVEGAKNKITPVNGILADEMGLGKTCQTISFLAWLKYVEDSKSSSPSHGVDSSIVFDHADESDSDVEQLKVHQQHNPHLVIAPASVISNWQREFEKFAPQLNVVKYHGTMNERLEIQDNLRDFLPGRKRQSKGSLDVILAPITYFQKEKSDDRAFLKKFRYSYLVVDEAHLLKNAQGLRYKNLDRFSTMHRLLLTGTPVQNNPKELLALLCFLMPLFSRKGGNDFDDADRKNDGGEEMLQHFVSMQSDSVDDQVAYKKLKQLFSPFVLRRRKMDVLSQIMMPKIQEVIFVELDESARVRYNSVIAENLEAKKRGTSKINDHLFTQLRKAAHHPLMLRCRHTATSEKDHLAKWFYQYGAFKGEACSKAKVADELEKYNDFEIHLTASELCEENSLRRGELERYILDEQDLFCSAKFVYLQKKLPKLIEEGHRILLFSVWTSCLDLLSCLLQQMDLKSLRMDGSTPVSERQNLIDEFNTDPTIPIFLLSTKACGLGINLTAADTCIMHDLDFNPFNDLQAEDRCHRIGQTKKVTILKLVTKETVDEDIYAMQQRKSKMNAAIMDSDWIKREKEVVMKAAVQRYLQSPKSQSNPEKENRRNSNADDESV